MIFEFATIVSLIGQFRQERGSAAQSETSDFLQWLIETNHAEMMEHLSKNSNATIYIKALLNQDHRIFKEKLERIDTAVAAFASTMEGFNGLANSVSPSAALSDQAIHVLRQFENAGASKVLEMATSAGKVYQFTDGKGGILEVSDQRFIEDDLKVMVGLGLLRHESTGKGSHLYCFTRAASKLVQERS